MTHVACHCDTRFERHSGFESSSDRVHEVLMDPIASLQDDETIFVEDEEDETFLLLLEPFDFADVPLRVTLLLLWMAEDEDSSSFTDVLLSSPQAVRLNAIAKNIDGANLKIIKLLPYTQAISI